MQTLVIIPVLLLSVFLTAKSYSDQKQFFCQTNVIYRNGIDGEELKAKIDFSITKENNKRLSIYDHGINLYYNKPFIIRDDSEYIYATADDNFGLTSIKINKKNKYLILSIISLQDGFSFHTGYCK